MILERRAPRHHAPPHNEGRGRCPGETGGRLRIPHRPPVCLWQTAVPDGRSRGTYLGVHPSIDQAAAGVTLRLEELASVHTWPRRARRRRICGLGIGIPKPHDPCRHTEAMSQSVAPRRKLALILSDAHGPGGFMPRAQVAWLIVVAGALAVLLVVSVPSRGLSQSAIIQLITYLGMLAGIVALRRWMHR